MKEPDSQPVQPPASVLADAAARLIAAGVVAPPTHPGQLGRVGRYELLRKIGEGGMGVVFLARDSVAGARVAIKLPRAEYVGHRPALERFVGEARRLQQLHHPHIVPVLDICEAPSGPYFSMPYFERGSLAGRLRSGSPLSAEETHRLATEITEALSFAHHKGIIHRDINPRNILLENGGGARVADFGLARTVFNDLIGDPNQSHCEGTAPYMSPQVARGEAEDTRCDIYAFGAVLYEMLSGQRPYSGATVQEILGQILAGPPKPIAELNPAADRKLVAVAEAAMARAQRDRYANMADVGEDLRRIRTGAVPRAKTRGWRPSLHRSATLRRTSAMIGVLAIALLGTWLFWPSSPLQVLSPFRSALVTSWTAAAVAEWDGQPGGELLVPEPQRRELLAFTADGRFIQRWPYPRTATEIGGRVVVTDLNSDGFDECFLDWTDETNLAISVVNAMGYELRRFTIPAPPSNPDPTNALQRATLAPLRILRAQESPDRQPRLLAELRTGRHRGPRGLYSLGLGTNQPPWHRLFGPLVEGVQLIDLGPDRDVGIVCGSQAVSNRVEAEGIDDTQSRILAFSQQGELLWQTALGGPYSTATPLLARFDTNGAPALLAWVRAHEQDHANKNQPLGAVVRLDPRQGTVTNSYAPTGCVRGCLALDIDADGRDEILCSDCEGYLHLLNPDLSLRRKVQLIQHWRPRPGTLDAMHLELIAAGPFARGAPPVIVAKSVCVRQDTFSNPGYHDQPQDTITYEQAAILLVDAELQVLARYPLAKKMGAPHQLAVKPADMDGDGFSEILILRDDVTVLKVRGR